jgi:hypothetical protein
MKEDKLIEVMNTPQILIRQETKFENLPRTPNTKDFGTAGSSPRKSFRLMKEYKSAEEKTPLLRKKETG